jgi:hypothetical protein
MQKATFNQLSFFSIKNRLTWLLIRKTKTYSFNLMKFFYFSQVWWNLISSTLTSRSHQDLMSRSQFDEMRLFESSLSRSQRHIRRSTSRERAYVILSFETRQSKHWRWNDQTKSREWIVTNNFCMRKSVSYFSNHISHDREQIVTKNFCTRRFVSYFSNHISHRDKTQNTLSNIFSQQIVSSIFIAIAIFLKEIY